MPAILGVALIVVVINLPCGYYRAGARRFSLPWIVAVHAPVPAIIALRYAAGLGWKLYTFPILIGAYAAGQLLGGRWRRLHSRSSRPSPRASSPR